MKILFSPSETKYKGGTTEPLDQNSFLFPNLFNYRMEAVDKYQNFIDNATNEQLIKLFGTKKQDIIEYYKGNHSDKEIMKAVERYDGVAYDYLKYSDLNKDEKDYIDSNVIIFSNLYGPILASDKVQDYKLKQTEKLGNFALENFYKEHFSEQLDEFLENEDILDLRAGFYEKFYKISKPYTTMKFIKDGKVVSHWAKAYRGIVLREMAKNNTQSIAELMSMEIENLAIKEIRKQKFKTEITYDII
ncbi:MAG: YaaA family protein [Campylobacterales bacterium]|nr:YaaA family protein [Campylobacterales bacterium]